MSNIKITDLKDNTEVTQAQADAVKGGPAFMKLGDIKGECRDSVPTDSFSLNFEKARF